MSSIEESLFDGFGNPISKTAVPPMQIGISVKGDRAIALDVNASSSLLAQLAQSLDKQTLRNVARNPQTPAAVLIRLAPKFPDEFFLNPVFDLMLLESPGLLFELPVRVLTNILKRPDCPDSFLHWAAKHGKKSHQLALVSRSEISDELLSCVACGPHVKPSEAAAERLMTR